MRPLCLLSTPFLWENTMSEQNLKISLVATVI